MTNYTRDVKDLVEYLDSATCDVPTLRRMVQDAISMNAYVTMTIAERFNLGRYREPQLKPEAKGVAAKGEKPLCPVCNKNPINTPLGECSSCYTRGT